MWKLYATFIIFFSIFYICFAIFYNQFLANGDEVHYLVATHSFVTDHDTWLENNYHNSDINLFRPEKNLDQLTYQGLDGHQYPIHGILYPLFLIPGYSLGGKLGVLIVNAFIATILVLRIFSFSQKVTRSKKLSFWVTAGVALNLPLVHFSILIFTEILGALFILELVNFLWFKKEHYLVIPLLVTILPWINIRFFPISFVVLLIWFWQNKNHFYKLIWGVVPIISVASFFIFLKLTSGSWNPAQPFEQIGVPTTSGNILFNLLNHLIDRQYGLLTYAPLYIFVIPGIVVWFHKNWHQALTVLFLSGVYLAPILRYSDWQGGYTPPARYLVALLPLLIPAIVFYLQNTKAKKLIFSLAFVFFFWGLIVFITGISLAPNHGFIFIDGVSPSLWHISQQTKVNLHSLLPSFYPQQKFTLLHGVWVVIIGASSVLLLSFRSNFKKQKH